MERRSGRTPPIPVGWIAFGKSGTPSQVLEVQDDWAIIRTADNRYLRIPHTAIKRLVNPDVEAITDADNF